MIFVLQLHFITKPGEQLRLVGSLPQFGLWNPKNSCPLIWTEGHFWNISISWPLDLCHFEYKFIFCKGNMDFEIFWEEGPNRSLFTKRYPTILKEIPLSSSTHVINQYWGKMETICIDNFFELPPDCLSHQEERRKEREKDDEKKKEREKQKEKDLFDNNFINTDTKKHLQSSLNHIPNEDIKLSQEIDVIYKEEIEEEEDEELKEKEKKTCEDIGWSFLPDCPLFYHPKSFSHIELSPPLLWPSFSTNTAIVVIDNGTRFTRSGIAGEQQPDFIFPTCYVKSKQHPQEESSQTESQDPTQCLCQPIQLSMSVSPPSNKRHHHPHKHSHKHGPKSQKQEEKEGYLHDDFHSQRDKKESSSSSSSSSKKNVFGDTDFSNTKGFYNSYFNSRSPHTRSPKPHHPPDHTQSRVFRHKRSLSSSTNNLAVMNSDNSPSNSVPPIPPPLPPPPRSRSSVFRCKSRSPVFKKCGESIQPFSSQINLGSNPSKSSYEVHYPVFDGVISNFSGMECIWRNTMNKVDQKIGFHHINPSVLLSESIFNPSYIRKKTMETFFEEFEVSGFGLKSQEELCMYNYHGMGTCLVVSCGVHSTHVVPIYCGSVLRNAITSSPIAGEALSLSLRKSYRISETEWNFGYQDWEYLKKGVEVARTKSDINSLATTGSVNLPNGRIFYFGEERRRIGEMFFEGEGSIPRLIQKSISLCPQELRNIFYQNILLNGQTLHLQGLFARLTNDLNKIRCNHNAVRILSTNSPYDAWKGGSMIASNEEISPYLFVSRDLYEEIGPNAIDYMCS